MADNSHQSDGKSFTWLVGQMRKKYENITYTPDKYLNKEPHTTIHLYQPNNNNEKTKKRKKKKSNPVLQI